MIKRIIKYLAIVVGIILIDILLKKVYIDNPIYKVEIMHYIININDFIRIFVFMGILIYFWVFHNKNMTKASKVVFCIFISACLIYLFDRIIFRQIHYYLILPFKLRITFAALLFAIGWVMEVFLLIFHSKKFNKDIEKIQKERIDNLK